MKKYLRILVAVVCVISVLTSGFSALAAGYDVRMEPKFEYIDGSFTTVIEGLGEYEYDTYFYPTPFFKGYSVVHNNICVLPGFQPKFFDKSSYVVNAYGTKIDVGTYDCLGVDTNGFFDEEGGHYAYFKEYNNPAFNPSEGVNEYGTIFASKNGKCIEIDTKGNIIDSDIVDDVNDVVYDNTYTKTPIEVEDYKGKYFMAYKDPYYFFERDMNGREYVCYYNGLAVVAENQDENFKVGIVDKNDNIIVPFIYDMITPCYDKECWVLKDGKWGIIAVDNKPISVKVDDEDVEFDQIPLVINGRTIAPLRAIFEKLGATVDWNGETRTITSTKGDTVITMTVDKKEMYKNGEKISLDVPPQIVGERTLIPVRAIAEAFSCDVTWDGENQTVVIEL